MPTKNSNADRSHVDLASIFKPESMIQLDCPADKSTVLAQLVDALVDSGRLDEESASEILAALRERERFGTTGIGKGLAIPHLRCRQIGQPIGAAAIAPFGVDFSSLDGEPTHLILLLLSPYDERALHTEILGRIASILSNRALDFAIRTAQETSDIARLLDF